MNKILLTTLLLLTSCSDPGPIVGEAPITFVVPGLGTVTRFAVHSGNGGTHYIYRVDGRDEVSVTKPKSGKHDHQQTTVIVPK